MQCKFAHPSTSANSSHSLRNVVAGGAPLRFQISSPCHYFQARLAGYAAELSSGHGSPKQP